MYLEAPGQRLEEEDSFSDMSQSHQIKTQLFPRPRPARTPSRGTSLQGHTLFGVINTMFKSILTGSRGSTGCVSLFLCVSRWRGAKHR